MQYIKTHIKGILWIIGLTLIFSSILFTSQIYLGDDLYFHLNRINGIGNAIRDGQILPKLYPLTNFEFGYASPLFYCDIMMYPAAILYMLGLPLILAYKCNLFFYILLGTTLIYVLCNQLYKNDRLTYIVMCVYCLNPYRFIDAYYRAAFSEFLALTFMPLVLYAFIEVFYHHKHRPILMAISMALILLSHNLSFILVVILYVIILVCSIMMTPNKMKDLLIVSIQAAFIGFLLTAFFTLPLVEQMLDQVFKVSIYSETYSIQENIIPMFSTYNIFNWVENNVFSMADIQRFGIGVVSLFIPLLNIKKNMQPWIKVVSGLHYFFLALAFGFVPIYGLSIFNFLQFSFRFYILVYITSIILVSYALIHQSKWVGIAVCGLMLINLQLFNGHMFNSTHQLFNDVSYDEVFAYDHENQHYYDSKQTGVGEYLPIMQEDDFMLDSKKIKQVIDHQKIDLDIDYTRYMSEITFDYRSDDEVMLMLPLTFYKGYTGYAMDESGNKIKLDLINDPTYKKVSFKSIQGYTSYVISYKGTMIQHASLLVSMITLAYIIFQKIQKCVKSSDKTSKNV